MVQLEMLRVLRLKPCSVGACTFAKCPLVGRSFVAGSPQATCCVAGDLYGIPIPQPGTWRWTHSSGL